MQTISEIELMIECGICLEILDDTNKMLPCQHTFHRGCLENLLRKNKGSIHCPICRVNVAEPIDSLQRHFVLSKMVDEYWRKLTSASRTEDEDLAQATTISREEFRNGSYADLLKQIEELQMQLAIENSKQEAYINWIFSENPVNMIDKYQELIQYHIAIDKSEENESIGDERQGMTSNKKNLECQLACLKSILLDNNLSLSSGITSGISQLLAGVASHIGDLNDEQRTEVEMALRCLRGALMTFQNNESIQIQAVTDKMVTNNNLKSSNQDPTKNGSESTDAAINDLMKNLEVIKTIISEEGQTIQMAEHQNRNYLNQYPPNFISAPMPGISNPQRYASGPPFHVPYPLHDPPLSAYDWPPSASSAKLPNFSENGQVNFPPSGKNPTHDRGSRDKSPGFNELPNTGSQPIDIREERTTQIAEHQNQNYLNQYPPNRGGPNKSPGLNKLPNTGSQRIKDRPRGPPPPPPPRRK